MNRCHLVHVTEFQYDGPVSESYNEVRLRPMQDVQQSCISFRLTTTPSSRTSSHQDYYGNWVHQFNILTEHRRLRVEAESVVLLHDPVPTEPSQLSLAEIDSFREELCEDHFDFLTPTTYVPHLGAVRDLVLEVEAASGGTAGGFVKAACELVHTGFRYEKGATHVQSSIDDALCSRAGVCQDFAHLMLAIARVRGFPARYVSGYLVPQELENSARVQEVIGGLASHAWAEIFVPGTGWVAVDPTLGTPSATRHVRVAYGRDYGDVIPVRGVYKGHAGQRLSVDVRVRPVVDSEGHEQIMEKAAGTMPPAESDAAPQQQQ